MLTARLNIWEEEFLITHHGNNVSMREVQLMTTQKRKWWIERIAKQKSKEAEQAKRAAKRPKPAIRAHRRH